jgi:hypothetical protein
VEVDVTNRDRKRGPDPQRLKVDETDWNEAVKKALRKKPPEGDPPESSEPDDAEDPTDDDT